MKATRQAVNVPPPPDIIVVEMSLGEARMVADASIYLTSGTVCMDHPLWALKNQVHKALQS